MKIRESTGGGYESRGKFYMRVTVAPQTRTGGPETFRTFAEQWTSGELRREHPDHIDERESVKQDVERFEKHVYPHVEDVPLVSFTRAHADLVMTKLPPALGPPRSWVLDAGVALLLAWWKKGSEKTEPGDPVFGGIGWGKLAPAYRAHCEAAGIDLDHRPQRAHDARDASAGPCPRRRHGLNVVGVVVEMGALPHVVLDELAEHVAEMTLPEDDEMIQASAADRSNEPFGVCVAVGALRRYGDASRPLRVKSCARPIPERSQTDA